MRIQAHAKRRMHRAVSAAHVASLRRNFEACEDELTRVVSYLQRTAEEERHGLALVLHDDLGGALTAAKVDLHRLKQQTKDNGPAVERIARLSKSLDDAVNVERRAVEGLRPTLLDQLGLAAAIEHAAAAACKGTGLSFRTEGLASADAIPSDQALVVYRLIQEGLASLIDARRSKHIVLTISRDCSGFRLLLRDGARHRGAGIGALDERIASMRQRAVSLGGSLNIRNERHQGSRIDVHFPLQLAS